MHYLKHFSLTPSKKYPVSKNNRRDCQHPVKSQRTRYAATRDVTSVEIHCFTQHNKCTIHSRLVWLQTQNHRGKLIDLRKCRKKPRAKCGAMRNAALEQVNNLNIRLCCQTKQTTTDSTHQTCVTYGNDTVSSWEIPTSQVGAFRFKQEYI